MNHGHSIRRAVWLLVALALASWTGGSAGAVDPLPGEDPLAELESAQGSVDILADLEILPEFPEIRPWQRFLRSMRDPLGAAVDEMKEVAEELQRLSTGTDTQGKQDEIIRRLDKTLQAMQKECEQCRSASSIAAAARSPTRPLQDSIITPGAGGQGDLQAPSRSDKRWANLPPHERDRILQSLGEGHPARYRRILERYYKRLAGEEGDESAPPAVKSESRPTAKPAEK